MHTQKRANFPIDQIYGFSHKVCTLLSKSLTAILHTQKRANFPIDQIYGFSHKVYTLLSKSPTAILHTQKRANFRLVHFVVKIKKGMVTTMFNKLKEKLASFMIGRYGIDELYIALVILYIILFFVNLFLNSLILGIVICLVIVFAVWRSFSKNHEKRRKENAFFMRYYGKIEKWAKFQKRKFDDRKTHVYVKCPKCKAVLRLPKRKGKNTAVCPKCSNKFEV